jgi:anti-sigma B factor antagonist
VTKVISAGDPALPDGAPFTVRSEYAGHGARLALHGELDLATVALLDKELRAVWARDVDSIELDLRGLSFIGSAGIAAVLAAGARAREGGCALTLVRGRDDVHRIFELTGITGQFAFRGE